MKADSITVRRLLENRQRFCVPIYQRHYVWGRDKQWEPFWNDVRTKAIERLNGSDRRFSHFMGAVVLEAHEAASLKQVTSFQVVDGQQRLTTFQLYLAAARDYAQQMGFEDTVGLIQCFLFNDNENSMEEPNVERFKVWPTKYDRELFQDIVIAGRSALREKYSEHFYRNRDEIYRHGKIPKLLGAYGYFFDCIKHTVEIDGLEDDLDESIEVKVDEKQDGELLIPTDTERRSMELRRLNALWEALIEEFKVVGITLEEGDDAQVIFETLNERGEPLLASDLVRNNIFHRADAQRENADKLFEKYWKYFEDPFWEFPEKQGRYKKARIEFFLTNFIAGKIAGEVTISKIFSEYKAFIKKQATKATGSYESVEDEMRDLVDFSILYRRLLEPKSEDPLGNFALHLQPWDVTTVYPLVLRLWAEVNLEDEEKKSCLDMLLAFIVRRAICGLTPKNYNKFFLSVLRHLEANKFSKQNLGNFLTKQTTESARFPNDTEFERAWLFNPVYKSLPQSRVRAVLESIERKKCQNRYHETDQLPNVLWIEHILPKKWNTNWPLPSGRIPTSEDESQAIYITEENDTIIGEIVRRKRLLDTFGNLTLLTSDANRNANNDSFCDKKKDIYKHSLLVLNREITEKEVWNENQIEARGRKLFEDARTLWPYPSPQR